MTVTELSAPMRRKAFAGSLAAGAAAWAAAPMPCSRKPMTRPAVAAAAVLRKARRSV
jgi:hypothetical protein